MITTQALDPILWVQGWTGINHSYAMVNQYQLLALAKTAGLQLRYSELPLQDRWSRESAGAGFSTDEQAVLAAIQPYRDGPVSAIYRIHTPNTLAQAPCRVITFLVTEFGLDERAFVPGADVRSYVSNGNLVATPSQWARERIVDYGFDSQSVFVVPHGVDGAKFSPLSADIRLSTRRDLGYTEDDVIFLNVGGPVWNKGLDILLEAFFAVRQRFKNARLIVKDQQALYGLSAVTLIQQLVTSGKISLNNDDVSSIRVIPATLSLEQLGQLYGVADYYVSPYRAEGFNLPVIEAIACGSQVIVTAGGSTDDFCSDDVAIKVPSVKRTNVNYQGHFLGAYLEPDVSALIEILQRCASSKSSSDTRFEFGRVNLLDQFTWQRAANLITALSE
jgi:glycosyltransferase involved in cell wall biosynthesis